MLLNLYHFATHFNLPWIVVMFVYCYCWYWVPHDILLLQIVNVSNFTDPNITKPKIGGDFCWNGNSSIQCILRDTVLISFYCVVWCFIIIKSKHVPHFTNVKITKPKISSDSCWYQNKICSSILQDTVLHVACSRLILFYCIVWCFTPLNSALHEYCGGPL